MRYRIDLAYDGRDFAGWQIQPGEATVQEAVERALSTLLRAPVGVVGAGRTDTGVSATRYVAHFDFDGAAPAPVADAECRPDLRQLRYKLNAILPKSVSVSAVSPVSDDFHARFGARRRQYTYYVHRVKDPFLESRSLYCAWPELDFDAMNAAASALLGTHDFSCFEKTGGDNKTSVCTVYAARWEPYTPVHATPEGAGECWRFVIEADRFLRNMVRAIVGTLIEVGRGRRNIGDFACLILPPPDSLSSSAPSDITSRRSLAGESVPGHALYLTNIEY